MFLLRPRFTPLVSTLIFGAPAVLIAIVRPPAAIAMAVGLVVGRFLVIPPGGDR